MTIIQIYSFEYSMCPTKIIERKEKRVFTLRGDWELHGSDYEESIGRVHSRLDGGERKKEMRRTG